MTWFKDSSGHIIEQKIEYTDLYCSLCQKLRSKSDCTKLRMSNRNGELYEIKSYKYNKTSKVKIDGVNL
jgi:hypothetical protein